MASILETFILKFGTDNTDLNKGAESAKNTTDKLANSLKSTDDIGKKLSGGLASLIKQYGGVVAAAFSLRAILKGVNEAANYSAELGRISQALGISTENLDAWASAVKRSGGSAEGFLETAKSLTVELSKFATTGGSSVAPFFQILGIRMTNAAGKARDLFEILPELADSFQKLSKGRSMELGKSLGLDQATILLLQQGSKEVDRILARQKELGTVTKQDAEITIRFNEAWDDTAKAFRGLFTTVGASVLPAFTAVLNIFQKVAGFFREHSKFITGVIIALGTAILVFLVPPLVTAAASALVLYAPFLLIGAIVAALAVAFGLLYDDIMNFFEGNKSVTGEILKKWPLIGEVIKGIVEVFKTLWEIAKIVFAFIVDGIQGIISGFIKAIETVKKIAGAIKSFFGGTDSEVSLKKTQNALTTATTSPLAAVTSNSISNSRSTVANSSNNSVTTGPVTIQTQATDSEGIAASFRKSLEEQMRQTGSSFDDGVRA